jgi:hypothetical protein
MKIIVAGALLASAMSAPLPAQWIHYPTPGLPRTASGKPDLSAPAPRGQDGKPDLSGLWRIAIPSPGYRMNIAADLKPGEIQPWAQALFDQRMANLGKDDPWTVRCLPLGPRAITSGGLAKIIQNPGLIAILYEDLSYRQIFMDGRPLPQDPNPSWMGYSVGHWDGDTLVVDSTGFNATSWLDMGGHPHTEALHITERYHRRDFGHIDARVTFDDPKAYTRPWTVAVSVTLAPDTDLLEYVCAENEKDSSHLIGRTAEEKSVHVAPAVLASYVGTYQVISREDPNVVVHGFEVTLTGGQLFLDMDGKGKLPLTPLSETTFSPRLLGTYEFIKDSGGKVTGLVAHSAEGDLKAVRK